MNPALFLEIKNEYTEHLVDILTPYIYEGLTAIYNEAVKITNENSCKEKTLLVFQKMLQSINNWNQNKIMEETCRIKQLSNTSDYLDDLVKAVIKSNIIFLSYSNNVSTIIGQTFYNSLTIYTFIHRCYTECAKDAHNYPYLFYHDVEPMDYKRNQIIIQQNIEKGILRATRKVLPISMILKEFLVNSVNIIQEPPKIELISRQGPPPPLPRIPSERLDPKLEQDIKKLMDTENAKNQKQKIQAIMTMDKLLASIEPGKLEELSARKPPVSLKSPGGFLEANLTENSCNNLKQSDKKVIDINMEESIKENLDKKATSCTNISIRPFPNLKGKETMDREADFIEEYGSQVCPRKKKQNKNL